MVRWNERILLDWKAGPNQSSHGIGRVRGLDDLGHAETAQRLPKCVWLAVVLSRGIDEHQSHVRVKGVVNIANDESAVGHACEVYGSVFHDQVLSRYWQALGNDLEDETQVLGKWHCACRSIWHSEREGRRAVVIPVKARFWTLYTTTFTTFLRVPHLHAPARFRHIALRGEPKERTHFHGFSKLLKLNVRLQIVFGERAGGGGSGG